MRYKPPKYRLHKASGRAVIQFRPLFGPHPKYLPGDYGSIESQAAYQQVLEQITTYWRGQAVVTPSRRVSRFPSVRSVVLEFLIWAETYHGAKSSEFGHYKQACKVLRDLFGDVLAAEFGPVRLKEVRRAMVEKETWSRKTVNRQIGRIRAVFKWAAENELVDASIVVALKQVEGLRAGKTEAADAEPIEPVEWADVLRILPYLVPVVRAMVEIQFLTGMRSDELTGMTPSHLDRRQEVWFYEPKKHKTAWRGKKKFVPIGPRSRALLEPYLEAAAGPAQFIFSPGIAIAEQMQARAAARKTKLTPSAIAYRRKQRKTKPRYDSRSYYHAIQYAFDKAEREEAKEAKAEGRDPRPVVRWHPHQLRHTRATETRAAYGMEGAQAQLGNTYDAALIYAEASKPLAIKIAKETG